MLYHREVVGIVHSSNILRSVIRKKEIVVMQRDLALAEEQTVLAPDESHSDGVASPARCPVVTSPTENVKLSMGSDATTAAIAAARRLARLEFRRSLQRTLEQLGEEVPLLGRLLAFERELDLRVARLRQLSDENAAAALLLDAASNSGDGTEVPLDEHQVAEEGALPAFSSLTGQTAKKGNFRLFVYNTFAGQEIGGSERLAQSDPSWTLRMQGQVLDTPPAPELAFTSVFERVVIEIDPENSFHQSETIEWRRPVAKEAKQGLRPAAGTAAGPATTPRMADAASSADTRDGSSAGGRPASSILATKAAGVDTSDQDEAEDAFADGIEVHRCGDQPVPIRILLYPRRYPPVYRLSPELFALLGVEEDTLAGVLMTFWHYIRRQGLVHPERPGYVLLNEELCRLFGWQRQVSATEDASPDEATSPSGRRDPETNGRHERDNHIDDMVPMMPLVLIEERLREHLGPALPIDIRYTIQLQSPVEHDCYDIEIDLPTNARPSPNAASQEALTFTEATTVGAARSADRTAVASESHTGTENDRSPAEQASKPRRNPPTPYLGRSALYAGNSEIRELQSQFEQTLECIHTAYLRRDFFQSFADAPTAFLRDLVVSQARDARLVRGHSGRTIEEERRSGLYYQQWVHEAVPRYLWRTLRAREQHQRSSQPAAGAAAKPTCAAPHPVT